MRGRAFGSDPSLADTDHDAPHTASGPRGRMRYGPVTANARSVAVGSWSKDMGYSVRRRSTTLVGAA